MTQPLQNRPRRQTQRWLKPCGVLSLLAGCYLLADVAQAFSPFSQRVMQSHLQAGLAQLSQVGFQPLTFSTEGRLNPVLSNGLKGKRLDQDIQLFNQIKQDSPTVDEPETTETDSEPRVQVAEVVVEARSGELSPELRDLVYEIVETQAGGLTTRSQLQQDINNIFSTGFFADVDAQPEDTDLGVRVTFVVEPNPVLTDVRVLGNEVLPQAVVDQIFADQKGQIINLRDFQEGILELNQWYRDNGYVLAQVVTTPQVSTEGVVTLEVAEGVIENIEVRYINDLGQLVDEEDNPMQGRTRSFIITREFETQPGDVFNQANIEQDLQRVFGLGIFGDVVPGLEPSPEDPRKVNVVVNVSERNTGSISTGLGLDFSGDVFGTIKYSQDNLSGRGQKASLEGQIGNKKTTLTTSLNSVGSVDGKPAVPENLKHAAEAVIDARRQDQQQPITQFDWSQTIAETEAFVRLAQEDGNQSLTALALNNLASFYGSSTARLSALNDALAILDNVGSPALEINFLLRQASVYRQLSEPNKALENYIAALNLLTEYQHERDLSILLGKDFLEPLSAEWQIVEDQTLQGGVEQIINFVKLGILLDTTFTYSILGDYQAGLYVASSQDVLTPTSSLTDGLNDFLNDEKRIREFIDPDYNAEQHSDNQSSVSFGEQALSLIFEPLLPVARKSVNILLSSLPETYRLQSSKLLFFDFDEVDSVARYEAEIDSYWQSSRRQLSEFFYLGLLALTSEEMAQYFSENSPHLMPIAKEIHALLPSAYNAEAQSWNADVLEEIFVLSKDYFLEYLDDIEDEQLADLISNSSGLIEFLFQDIVSDKQFEKDTPEYYQRRVELSQAVLDNWPDQADEILEFEWAKGFVFKWQGDALYKLGDYSSAINAYNAAIPWLIEAENFYQNGSKARDSNINVFLAQLKGIFGPFIDQVLLAQRLTASLNSADAHLLLNKPTVARDLYKEALNLSDQLNEIRTGWEFVYKQSERAEIFYGIAQAEAMLGNWDAAAGAIEEAIAINEASFPNEALSGGTGVLSLGFLYGYGVPYQGSISGSFKFETNNPWLAANSGEGFLVENRCSIVTKYFACKQKYFGLYIDLLMQRHQQNPDAGYDVLAFEASEQAKAFSFRRPDSVVSAQDQFAPARSFSDIQSAISDDDTLVLEFFLGEKASYLWVLTGDGGLDIHPLPPRAIIEAKAQEFYDLLTSPPGRARPKTTAEVGQELSKMLFEPVAHQLGTQRLVIIADGFLQYLPFSVLPNPAPDHAPSETALQGEYGQVLNPLLLDHEIVHLPSASTLVALRQNAPHRPAPTKQLAFFANPIFNHRDNRVDQVKLFDWSEPMTATELSKVEVLHSEIPATERELDSVLASDLLPAGEVQQFFGYDASLEAALSPDLGQFRMVHFASHGIFNSKAPERSGIVLSGLSEAGVVQSGLLSPTYAFNEMDLSATELVVLSGCRTGLSQGQIGREGMTGLTNGLFDAGAERVVASLWSVRDDATRELMKRFYRLMLDPDNPMRPAEALTEAQRSMWNEPRWQTPYNWAAFTLQGEWQ